MFEFVYANTEFIVSSCRKKLFFSLLHMLHVSARFLTLLNITKLYTKPTTLSVVFLYLIIIYNYFMMFSITKVVQGSFNQSHPKFGETAGIQCACNSLFSICWSKIRQVNRWNKYDLDHVLNNGDGIYKFLLYGPGPLDKIRFTTSTTKRVVPRHCHPNRAQSFECAHSFIGVCESQFSVGDGKAWVVLRTAIPPWEEKLRV